MSLISSPPDLPAGIAPALRGWHVAGATFCCLMLGLHIAAGYNSAGVADFWRDMYWATSIAYGERFPLSGPPINNLLELGPWWFYLLAVPIWLSHRIVVASVFIQILAALKYFLAWRLGSVALDARFGLAFAVSLAVAGWSTAGFWLPSHTALIETTLFLLAFAVWRTWRVLSAGNAVLFGLAAAASIHAHPTTALYIALAGLALLWRHRSWRCGCLLAVSASVVMLSLLPPWFDTSVPLATMQTTLAAYASNDVGVDFLHRIPGLVNGLLLGGAWVGFLVMTRWSLQVATIAWYAYCACLGAASLGMMMLQRHSRLRGALAASVCLLLAQVAFLAIVRPLTPIWMVSSCLPPLAFALALCWYGWFCAESRSRRSAGSASACFTRP